jgi:hypothetical protein
MRGRNLGLAGGPARVHDDGDIIGARGTGDRGHGSIALRTEK